MLYVITLDVTENVLLLFFHAHGKFFKKVGKSKA